MIVMDKAYADELSANLKYCIENGDLTNKDIYLFGHCEATLILADMLFAYGVNPVAIMDNNEMKYGISYKGIPVQNPNLILKGDAENAVVLIVTRFYEAMSAQLRKLGFKGDIRKLVDYNTYAEYSLFEDVVLKKQERLNHGKEILAVLRNKYPGHTLIFCPFRALGDVFFCMSYLPAFMKKRGMDRCAVCVIGRSCGAVVSLFGDYSIEIFEQKNLDMAVQACLYENRNDTFVAHQDRPYVVDLYKALYLKKISLEKIYCCGVFGLPIKTKPVQPVCWEKYPGIDKIEKKNAVILSPYAKSVTPLPNHIWEQIIYDYKRNGYQVFTNVAGEEEALKGTEPMSPKLSEMKSVVEQAGTFIGIRSGLCDVIRSASCRKVALYPDYQYCDTKWKAIDIYAINEFENIAVKEGFKWKKK